MDPNLVAIITSGTPATIFAFVFLYILNKYISTTEKREEWFRVTVKELTDKIEKLSDKIDHLELYLREERRRTNEPR